MMIRAFLQNVRDILKKLAPIDYLIGVRGQAIKQTRDCFDRHWESKIDDQRYRKSHEFLDIDDFWS